MGGDTGAYLSLSLLLLLWRQIGQPLGDLETEHCGSLPAHGHIDSPSGGGDRQHDMILCAKHLNLLQAQMRLTIGHAASVAASPQQSVHWPVLASASSAFCG
jgi:hypothetical protein